MDKEFKDLNNDELYKLIGNNVAKFRKRANMSQLELSLEMGNKSTSVVASAEIYKNNRKFNITQLHKISKILNVNYSSLFNHKNDIING